MPSPSPVLFSPSSPFSRGVHGPETMGLYIVGGTCVRNRINLSLGNYKEPYIRQPATRRLGCSTLVEEEERNVADGKGEKIGGGRWDQPRFERGGGGGGGALLPPRFEGRVHFDSRGRLQRQRICRLPPLFLLRLYTPRTLIFR